MPFIGTLAALAVALLLPTAVFAWQATLRGNAANASGEVARAVAFTAAGDVVAIGELTEIVNVPTPGLAAIGLVRFDGGSGRIRWKRALGAGLAEGFDLYVDDVDGAVIVGGVSNARAYAAAVDLESGATRWTYDPGSSPAGAFALITAVAPSGDDVVGVGRTSGPGTFLGTVVKLDGTTGAELWRRSFAGTGTGFQGIVRGLAIDAAGDVVVTGAVVNAGTEDDFFVAKVSGATGGVLWSVVIADPPDPSGAGSGRAVAIDAAGDVLVAGSTETDRFVKKLAGVTGVELWHHPVTFLASNHLALDPLGDVFVIGATDAERLDGTSGASLWSTPLPDVVRTNDAVVAPDGDLLVAGASVGSLAVLRLAGASGDVEWSAHARGRASPQDLGRGEAHAVAVHPSRGIAAAGWLKSFVQRDGPAQEDAFAVLAFDERLTGQKATVVDPPGDPAGRRLALVSKDGLLFGPLPWPSNDPRTDGGTLTLVDTVTQATTSFALPASNWKVQGDSNLKPKYTYKDARRDFGPCRSVVLQQGKKLTLTCDGAGLGFDLGAAAEAGGLGVVLRVADFHHCLVFGGDVSNRGNGRYQLREAPAPGACPDVP